MDGLSGETGAELYLKDDGNTGPLYGGNKVRKLGFLLAAAKEAGAKTVLTFGAAGSNHATATAIYAKEAGLGAISMLVPQPVAYSVRKNLLRSHAAGASLNHFGGLSQVAMGTAWQFAALRAKEGVFPHVIPTGGSSPTGILGFVNAALELKQQVDAGEIPAPDVIYVASGTMGTAIGLLLGARLAGMPLKVEAVRVTVERFTNLQRGRKLFETTNALLHAVDPDIPLVPFPEEAFRLRHEFLGQQYALYTEEAVAAMKRMKACEGLQLEGTYTGKALACLLSDAASGALSGKKALFWNTYNRVDISTAIAHTDYHSLPQQFHRYFEEPVQPLDEVK
jgi:1-aminocyclopropane-1-carboxylate deaminase/D-cysteine desulfhydrase-like pyridoxal-dependent ACC family enzyme